MAAKTVLEESPPGLLTDSGTSPWLKSFEILAVISCPIVVFFALRLRAMAPNILPDPSMHTIFLLDPHDLVKRYGALYSQTARLREGYRVGFLVPARLADMAFGAIPGFFVTRYVFAMVAVVPTYLLLRRHYGAPGGAAGVLAILACPVVITAWGTDYPDSAVISYAIGGTALLAMAHSPPRRRLSLTLGAALLVLAAWSHGVGIVVAAVTVLGYLALRLARDRTGLVIDVAIMATVAVLLTFALGVASKILLVRFDFVLPTINSFLYLSQHSQTSVWHSHTWRWAPYDTYLLVPPAVVVAWGATFLPRARRIPSAQLMVGVVAAGELATFSAMQFAGSVQMLEDHYFASPLWGATCLALAVTVCELAKPLRSRRFWRWTPAIALFAVPLCYEADPHVPSFEWWPVGAAVALLPIPFILVARALWPRANRHSSRTRARGALVLGSAAAIVASSGCALVLTVTPVRAHQLPPGAVPDPATSYPSALGGSWSSLLDSYKVTTELPGFVGNATYTGEQLLVWWKWKQVWQLIQPLGIYHSGFNLLPTSLPQFTPADAATLNARKPAELLFMTTQGRGYKKALASLAPYQPRLLRRTVLRSGSYALHLWLVILEKYWRGPQPAAATG